MSRWVSRAAMAATVMTMAQSLAAQERAATAIPDGAMPPAGMCRVWLPNVPEGQQPAPTDCATAIRMAPRSASVLFGDLKGAGKVQDRPAAARSVAVPAFRGNAASAVPASMRTGASVRAAQSAPAVAPAPATAAATKAADDKSSAKPIKP